MSTPATYHQLEIRYNHRSTQTADNYAAALAAVRAEMLPQKSAPVEIKCDDGVYVYRDQDSADRDDTGARAFAVICQPESTMNTTTITTAAVANALHAMGYALCDYEIEEQDDGVRSITIKVASGDDDDAWMDELTSALPKGAVASWDGNSNTDKYGETTEYVTIAWRVMDDHHEE